MGSPLYDFLTESFFFEEEEIASGFSRFSDQELLAELERYREHALSTAPEPSTLSDLDFRVSSGSRTVPVDTLRQGAFYIKQVISDDPLFRLTHRQSEAAVVASQAIGLNNDADQVNRSRLLEAVGYLKAITPMVATDYVVPLPVSYLFEPPAEIPINLPTDRYAGLLPGDLREWFWDRVELSTLKRTESGWADYGTFELGRGLRVSFRDANMEADFMYHLHKMEILDYDEESGVARFEMTIPDDLPDKNEFLAWVDQSVNKSAYDIFDRVRTEASFAYDLGSSYLAPSPLAFDLLQQTVGSTGDVPSHTANTLLNVDLPLLDGVDTETLMRIRRDEGEAFESFRTELERAFRDLRLSEESEEKRVKLENELHELTRAKVHDVQQEVEAIKKRLPFEVTAGVLALASGFITGGLTTVAGLAALGAAAKAGMTAQDLKARKLKHPAYFLWKVKQASGQN